MSENKSTLRYLIDSLANLLHRFRNWSVYIIATYAIIALMFVYGGIGILELISIDTGIPDHIVPYVIPSALTVWALLPFVELVRKYVANPPKEILSEIDPEDGDRGIKYLYPSQWQNLTVVDVVRADDGTLVEVEKDRSDLHDVDIDTDDGVVSGHECEFYDPSENKAYVSFFGSDVSGGEIRRHKNSTEYLKHEASAEKDIHQRLRNLYPDLVEQAVHNRMNYYIHVVEGEQVPGKKSIRSIIDQGIKDSELQEYVEEDPNFDDMIDVENPFDEQSMAKQYQQMMEAKNGGDDDE